MVGDLLFKIYIKVSFFVLLLFFFHFALSLLLAAVVSYRAMGVVLEI
jgi:hypothetical protein